MADDGYANMLRYIESIASRGIVAKRARTDAAAPAGLPSSACSNAFSTRSCHLSVSSAARNGRNWLLRISSETRVQSNGGSTRMSRLTRSGRSGHPGRMTLEFGRLAQSAMPTID